jgi:esterase/lipase
MNLILKLIRLKFSLLSFISPAYASGQALNLFQRPHFQKIRDREKDFLEKTKILRLPYSPEDIIIYEVGNKDGKKVLMVHGWDSNPGSMAGIAEELIYQGFHVLVFNVPAHGISVQKTTNMLYVSDILIHVLKKFNIKENISIVTHSFGSGATSFALKKSGIKVDKLVFITSPDKLYDIFKDFADRIGLTDKAFRIMCKTTEKKFNYSFEEMQISKLLESSHFNKLLLIHDKKDTILPFKNAEVISRISKNTELYATEDKGHYRILWDKTVIGKIRDFLLQ